jgi:hypothetical protein
MVRILLNIQLLFYGIPDDFRKIANFNQFKNILYLVMESLLLNKNAKPKDKN